MAENKKMQISKWIDFLHRFLADDIWTRDGDTHEFCDQVFKSEMGDCVKTTKENYNNMKYRDAFHSGFTKLQKSFQKYQELSREEVNRKLIVQFIEVQALLLAPLYPVISEYVWCLLQKPTSIINAEWPSTSEINPMLTVSSNHVLRIVERFQVERDDFMQFHGKESHKFTERFGAIIYVSNQYSDWQKLVLKTLRWQCEPCQGNRSNWKNIASELKKHPSMQEHSKKILPFVAWLEEIAVGTNNILTLSSSPPFDELMAFKQNSSYIFHSLKVNRLEIRLLGKADITNCETSHPICKFEQVPEEG